MLQIVQGGKVPKELYFKNDKKINALAEDMTLVNIKKGDKLYLKYTVTIPQSFLRYLYNTIILNNNCIYPFNTITRKNMSSIYL